jgi:hypothetical protein
MDRTRFIRTDFSDKLAWNALRAELRELPVELREAYGKNGVARRADGQRHA